MFGLFKTKVTPAEYGLGVFDMALDWVGADAGRSLGARFENYDASDGWPTFLERNGVSASLQNLYFRHYAHCALQAAFSQYEHSTARKMTIGAMNGFTSSVDGYDIDATFATLDAAYHGQRMFSPSIEPLTNTDAEIRFLPNSNSGVLNAKYLIENFVLPHMSNSSAFIESFKGYSSTVCATVGTVQRAIEQSSRSFKLS